MNIPTRKTLFEFGSASDVGRTRSSEPNQDTVEVVVPAASDNWHPPLLIVADGMGGHRGGATASQMAVRVFKQEFQRAEHPTDYSQLLPVCCGKAHLAIRASGKSDPNLSDMGTTIVAVVLDESNVYGLNVGDSRAYILRGNKLMQLSQDQSWVASQARAGILTPQEAIHHPHRNRLEMAITASRLEIKPYLFSAHLDMTDIIVLCSDGLWGVVPDSLIWAAATELVPQEAAEKLVDLANRSNSSDNISVIVARRIEAGRKLGSVNLEDTHT